MRHPERWKPTKYVLRGGRLRASTDPAQVGAGSRLMADITAALYEEHLPRYARGRLVDLGCGTAPLYGSYRLLVDEAVCVDWPGSVHALEHLDHEVDLNEPLPFADARFDTIVLSDVLEHLARPWLMWREMARILAPGGHALVNVPFLYGVHEAPHDYYRYTEHALRAFARDASLEVLLLQPTGGSLHVLTDLLAKHFAHVPVVGRPLAIGLQGACAAFGRSAAGRRIADRTAAHFTLGYFMVVRRHPALAAPGRT